jgi:pectin methylesterase-like acyl-CoA thioesterase
MKSIYTLLLVFFVVSLSVLGQQLAFPGAEGGGRFTTGGRGGTVYEVTTLSDAGVGSLRDAISQPNRTIVFRVSGVINLQSRLAINKNNITIAGQTAPGDGICLKGYCLNIQASNIIIRYIRCRFSDANNVDDDAMNSFNGLYENIIIDHCSMSWSIDETATFYGIKNFTLQWSLVAESLYRSKHDKGDHGYGGIWGGANASFHHNLIAHHTSRTPRFGGARPGYTPYPTEELVDFRNNVIYNWGSINSAYGGEGGRVNMVNNYYKPGPATPGSLTVSSNANKRNRILNYTSFTNTGTDTTWGGKFYITGNVVEGYPDVSTDNWTKGVQKDGFARGDALIATAKVATPFVFSMARTQTADAAYKSVLDSVGAILPRRDAIDARIVKETQTGTATYEGAAYKAQTGVGISHPSGIIDSQDDTGGFIKYGSSTAPDDTDHDGMADAWERANNLNPDNAADRNLVATNGYTNLENYLNNITKDTGVSAVVYPTTGPLPYNANVMVAKDRTGNYLTVQEAIDAAPTASKVPYIIYIKNGLYKEKVTIPSNKPFIYLIGESAAKTLITWDDYSGKAIPTGGTYGTTTSATMAVKSDDCLLMNITFENTTGDAPQALAINIESDRVAVKSCVFLGGQDTVLSNGDGKRQYFKNCYIDGVVDFVFGSASAVFDSCVVYAKDRVDGLSGSYITAANTPNTSKYGYIFRNCFLPSNRGATSYVLGRPWQNDASTAAIAKKYNKVVFLNSTYGDKIVKPEGWATWDTGTNTDLITYAEYKSKKYNGTAADVSKRVTWSKQLTDAQATEYLNNTNVFGAWNPCALFSNFCSNTIPEIAIVNLKIKKSTSSTTTNTFLWNVCWPMTGLKYELHRSTDNKATFTKVTDLTAITDTIINYSVSEANPPAGKTYFYVLKGTKTGLNTYVSDTMQLSSVQSVVPTAVLSEFLQGIGTPSASQIYTIAGENLTENLTITPPPNYEVSANNGLNWWANKNPLVLTPKDATIVSTNVLVRLNANIVGTYAGNITHSSTGAAAKVIAITGKTQADPLPVSKVLSWWSFTRNIGDSTALRDNGITVSTPVLKKLFLSNGTAIAAYSTLHGQSTAPTADGLWTTAGGGFGNNLSRALYEQFVIKAKTGYSVRIDSLVMKSSLFQAATGKLAVVYSKSGFKTDSSNVVGGTAGTTPLIASANGAFATPVLPASDALATTTPYSFSMAGSAGVTLAANDSLTVRVYFSTGSSSAGRYAKLKDVQFKGFAKDLNAPPPAITITTTLKEFTQIIGQKPENQTYSVAGANLLGDVVVIPTDGFEVSLDGMTWYNNSTVLRIPQNAGKVAATNILVRFTKTTLGSYTGEIAHISSGATAQNVPLKATVSNPLAVVSSRVGIELNPNPAEDYVTVQHPSSPKAAQLNILSVTGSKINSYIAKPNTTATTLIISHLQSSSYLIEYKNDNQRWVLKFVKK